MHWITDPYWGSEDDSPATPADRDPGRLAGAPLPGEQARQEEPPAADRAREAPLTTPEDTLGG